MDEILLVFFSLLGVIGLILLTYYGQKWMNKKFRGNTNFSSGKNIKIKECTGVSPDKQLIVVSVGKKTMLLGVTPAGINKISDLDEEDVAVMESNNSEQQGEMNFFKNLKQAFSERQQISKDKTFAEKSALREDKENLNDETKNNDN